jgi:hypothetical protein
MLGLTWWFIIPLAVLIAICAWAIASGWGR